MARLPGPADLGGVRIAESGRPIATVDLSAPAKAMEGFGASVSRAGDTFTRIGEYQKSGANNLEDVKATSDWLSKKVKFDEDRNNITDPAELDKFRQNYSTGLGEAANNISDPKRRELFMLRNAPTVTQSEVQVNDRKFELVKDADTAAHIEQLNKLEQVSLNSKSPEDRSLAIQTAHRAIDNLRDKGYIDEAQAAQQKINWARNYARKAVGMMSPEDRIAALGSGVNPADLAAQYKGFGEKNQPEVLTEFFRKTGGKSIDPRETPWCAAYADAVLGASGKQQAGTLRAADFLKYGTATEQPTKGDVVVFAPQAKGASGHVGFVVGIEGDRVRYIAGNDSNKVQENTLPLSQVVGFRIPPPANTPIEGMNVSAEGPKRVADEANKTVKPSPLTEYIPADERQPLIEHARGEIDARRRKEQAVARQDGAAVSGLMNDDLASIARSGVGLAADKLPRERIVRAMGEEGANQWEAARVRERKIFDATDGIETLAENEVEKRLKILEPAPGSEGYADDMKAYDRARQKSEKFLQARRSDPALSSEVFQSVREARQNAQYDDVNGVRSLKPESAQSIVRARLAAQGQLGITEPMAVTKSEAAVVARQLRAIGEDQPDQLRRFMESLNNTYGEYADEVLAATIQHQNVNRDLSVLASQMLSKIAAGSSPSPVDIRKVEDMIDAQTMRSAMPPPPDLPRELRGRRDAFGRNTQRLLGEQAADMARADELATSRTPPAPALATPKGVEDVKTLIKNPTLATEFDMTYGPGAADRVMKNYRARVGGVAR